MVRISKTEHLLLNFHRKNIQHKSLVNANRQYHYPLCEDIVEIDIDEIACPGNDFDHFRQPFCTNGPMPSVNPGTPL